QRNIARASTTKRAQSRRKQLEKMTKLDRPPGDEASANFSFHVRKTSGNDVLKVDNYSFTHDGEIIPLFSKINLHINRGERIALIGENGIGKTTLLKAILTEQNQITHGSNVEIGYYAQEQEKLSEAKTILRSEERRVGKEGRWRWRWDGEREKKRRRGLGGQSARGRDRDRA